MVDMMAVPTCHRPQTCLLQPAQSQRTSRPQLLLLCISAAQFYTRSNYFETAGGPPNELQSLRFSWLQSQSQQNSATNGSVSEQRRLLCADYCTRRAKCPRAKRPVCQRTSSPSIKASSRVGFSASCIYNHQASPLRIRTL